MESHLRCRIWSALQRSSWQRSFGLLTFTTLSLSLGGKSLQKSLRDDGGKSFLQSKSDSFIIWQTSFSIITSSKKSLFHCQGQCVKSDACMKRMRQNQQITVYLPIIVSSASSSWTIWADNISPLLISSINSLLMSTINNVLPKNVQTLLSLSTS